MDTRIATPALQPARFEVLPFAGSMDQAAQLGDADPPHGAYASAAQLLPVVAGHPLRPRTIGIPGKVSRAKLLELSARTGVGPSLSFLRKQRGIRALLSKGSTADRLYEKLAPAVDDPELHIAGFHIFTFNQLLETWRWHRAHEKAQADRPARRGRSLRLAEPEQGSA